MAGKRPKRLNRDEVEALYRLLAAVHPDPKTELAFVNSYTLLVAVVLSAQATDIGVNKATARLFEGVRDPQAMIDLGEAGLKHHIRTIGLFNMKAKNVIALSEALVAEHGGRVPNDRDALEKLPGVGRKTANVVLNVAFGAGTIAVDTHIFRVGNRTNLAPGATPRAVEDGLMRVTPAAYLSNAHHWLLLHGRYICKARTPECWRCPIVHICRFQPKTPPPLNHPEP